MSLRLASRSILAVLALLVPCFTAIAGPAAPAQTKGPLVTSGYKMVTLDPVKNKKILMNYQMGSPLTQLGRGADELQHPVALSKGLQIGATEVTQALWREVMGTEPFCKEFEGQALFDAKLPAQCISWFDALTFCNKLSEKEGLTPVYKIEGENVAWDRAATGYRLPTEAEWELAARAGTELVWSGTSDEKLICKYTNGPDLSAKAKWSTWETFTCDDKRPGPAPVGSFQANAWGLFDMSGNVSEWTWDWSAPYGVEAVTDPVGPEIATIRSVRGGSWRYSPSAARSTARSGSRPELKAMDLGFRIARNLP